jgi:hypothetical protein
MKSLVHQPGDNLWYYCVINGLIKVWYDMINSEAFQMQNLKLVIK